MILFVTVYGPDLDSCCFLFYQTQFKDFPLEFFDKFQEVYLICVGCCFYGLEYYFQSELLMVGFSNLSISIPLMFVRCVSVMKIPYRTPNFKS